MKSVNVCASGRRLIYLSFLLIVMRVGTFNFILSVFLGFGITGFFNPLSLVFEVFCWDILCIDTPVCFPSFFPLTLSYELINIREKK